MTILARLRRSPRWLFVLVGVAAMAVATASLAPHDEAEERSCLVCKAGHQPLTELTAVLLVEPPIADVAFTHKDAGLHKTYLAVHSSSPRAPPV